MSVISMKQLLEAGVHFGHQTRRWNPKMAPYIYTERNGIYIIDLQKTVGLIDDAFDAVAECAALGGTILFVGTKKQAQDAIKAEAERCGMFYVNERWLGGMLTNFKTIQGRIRRLKDIERMSEDGTFDVLPKKEVIGLRKEWEKLEKNIGGVKEMKKLPDLIFVVDPKKERICVSEARKLHIPLIGICDTNCDPDELDYVIPGNDDAIRAVKLIVSKMADAVVEANEGEAYNAEEALEVEAAAAAEETEPVAEEIEAAAEETEAPAREAETPVEEAETVAEEIEAAAEETEAPAEEAETPVEEAETVAEEIEAAAEETEAPAEEAETPVEETEPVAEEIEAAAEETEAPADETEIAAEAEEEQKTEA